MGMWRGLGGRALEGSTLGPLAELRGGALLQKQVSEGHYGPGVAELEQQIAEHNILQKEIEAYGQQLRSLIGPVGEPAIWTHPCLAPLPGPFSPIRP